MSKINLRYFQIKYLLIIACVAAGFSFFDSCSPDSGLGANVLPQNTLNANFKDSTTIFSSLVLTDTIPTKWTSNYLLGSYNDPIFGPTKSSFYTQLIYNSFPSLPFTTGGDTAILDSAVLGMEYATGSSGNYYGVINPQNIEVYALDKRLNADSVYYSNANVPHSTLLGARNLFPDFSHLDTAKYGQTYWYLPRWTVKLNHAWGQAWLDTIANSMYTGALATDQRDSLVSNGTIFQRHLKGLYVTTNNPMQFPGQGGLWYQDPLAGGSGIYFYYRIKSGSTVTYEVGELTVNSGCLTFSHFDHDYTTSPFYKVPSGKDSVFSPAFTYIQGLGGVKTKLTIPYLRDWAKKGPVIVNKAEIEIPVVEADRSIYAPPLQLYIIGINDTSTVYSTSTFALPDQSSGIYGGTYDAFNHRYTFIITQYIQLLISGKATSHNFYLVPGGSSVNANRVVLYGGKNTPRIRLKIYYTPLKA